eukprot:7025969-Prymnesium_polylepis.2
MKGCVVQQMVRLIFSHTALKVVCACAARACEHVCGDCVHDARILLRFTQHNETSDNGAWFWRASGRFCRLGGGCPPCSLRRWTWWKRWHGCSLARRRTALALCFLRHGLVFLDGRLRGRSRGLDRRRLALKRCALEARHLDWRGGVRARSAARRARVGDALAESKVTQRSVVADVGPEAGLWRRAVHFGGTGGAVGAHLGRQLEHLGVLRLARSG